MLSLRNNEWIKNAKDAKIIEAREKIENNSNGSYLSHHQYLSRMSLGTIIHITRKGRFQNKVMNLGNISFLDYDSSNRNFWIKDSRKTYFKKFRKSRYCLKSFAKFTQSQLSLGEYNKNNQQEWD